MRILITAGATKEYIDPIRFISNDSSGKMGVALLKEAIKRRHKIKFIYGSGSALTKKIIDKISKTKYVEKVINAITYNDFREMILNEISDCEVFICPAAISDFTVEKKDLKIKSNGEILLRLKPVEKLVKIVKKKFPHLFVVAFKAEYNLCVDELKNRAIEKLKKENLDIVVANNLYLNKFGADKAEVFLISKNKIEHIKGTKQKIAKKIFDWVEKKLKKDFYAQ